MGFQFCSPKHLTFTGVSEKVKTDLKPSTMYIINVYFLTEYFFEVLLNVW